MFHIQKGPAARSREIYVYKIPPFWEEEEEEGRKEAELVLESICMSSS